MTATIRHPRRVGFIAFNIIAAAAFSAAWAVRSSSVEDGVAGLPNLAIGTTAMVVIGVVWAATWLAWGWMVWSRRRRVMRHRDGAA